MYDSSEALYRLYNGFQITKAIGNNAFSFNQRKRRFIYVPKLVQGQLSDVQPGNTIVFSEIEEGVEKNHTGLEQFVHLSWNEKQIFIFDNHNHAFFFWHWAYLNRLIPANCRLMHIDQHKDTRKPEPLPDFNIKDPPSLEHIFKYTNEVLNVGNFIPAATHTGLIENIHMIDDSISFNEEISACEILDIDLDIFSPEMAYIDCNLKLNFIKNAISNAKFITIATSPFFMDQKLACEILPDILN